MYGNKKKFMTLKNHTRNFTINFKFYSFAIKVKFFVRNVCLTLLFFEQRENIYYKMVKLIDFMIIT